jgi:dinuclear metal center YbgI/SA1388 family protein
MITQQKLLNFLNDLLSPELFKDYAPNGLQVGGNNEIHKIVTGVTASLDFLKIAAQKNADAVIVHHGYFWKGEDPCVVGVKQQRLLQLLNNKINLFAYHLPLDAHQQFGNNVQLAKLLEINITDEFSAGEKPALGKIGELPKPTAATEFSAFISQKLNRDPLHIAVNDQPIKKIAWCTGAAQDFIEAAAHSGADAFISGEISERTFHLAKELNIHYYAAGHHATERYGVKALGEHLNEQFAIDVEFVDVPNPV